MRESIRTIVPVFNTHRMVKEYTERLYDPAAAAHETLTANACKKAVEVARWKDNIRRDWRHVKLTEVTIHTGNGPNVTVGDAVEVSVRASLGPIAPEFVRVQALVGEATDGAVLQPATIDLRQTEKLGNGAFRFVGAIPAPRERQLRAECARHPHAPEPDPGTRTAPDHLGAVSARQAPSCLRVAIRRDSRFPPRPL